jgi:hypothetical protein
MATPQELAQQIIDRNKQTEVLLGEMEQRAQQAASARLAPYGDTLEMYQDRFNEVYNPRLAQARSASQAMNQYASGLGDILVRRAREARKGSGKKTFDPYSGYRIPTLQELLAFFTPKTSSPSSTGVSGYGSADTRERRTQPSGVYGYGSADTRERRGR